jgi:hypothetical protein
MVQSWVLGAVPQKFFWGFATGSLYNTIVMIRFAALLLTIPLAAQTPTGKWIFVYTARPDIKGYYKDSRGGEDFDLKKDLGLEYRDKTGIGLHFEYLENLEFLGKRFAFSINYSVEDYSGDSKIERDFEIAGTLFKAGMDVTSRHKFTMFDAVGTWKVFSWDRAYLGLDFGIRAWYLDIKMMGAYAEGVNGIVIERVDTEYIMALAQFGVSGSYRMLNGRLVFEGELHSLSTEQPGFGGFGANVCYYFLPRLGVRFFADSENINDLDILADKDEKIKMKMNRTNLGLGIVARW